MKTARILTLILGMAAVGALAAYGQEMKQEAASAAAQTTQAGKLEEHDHGAMKEKRFVATVGADGVQHVEITGGSYYFDPNYIVVKANIPVELSVKKDGYVPHDIVVKAPEAGIDFEQSLDRKAKSIKFTPTKPGKYEMYCSKKLPFAKSHKDKGMDGMIEVVP
jgi:plastocyanin